MHQVIGWWIYLFFNLILLDIPGGPEFQLSNINPQTSPPHTWRCKVARRKAMRVLLEGKSWGRQRCWKPTKMLHPKQILQACTYWKVYFGILCHYIKCCGMLLFKSSFLSFFDLILTVRLQVVFFFLCWLFSIRVSSSTHGPSTLLQGPTAKMPSCTVWGESCYVTFSIACS